MLCVLTLIISFVCLVDPHLRVCSTWGARPLLGVIRISLGVKNPVFWLLL